jgi:ABC-type nitrate/sulfonate/bicarbonate transport system substrate-binding protein
LPPEAIFPDGRNPEAIGRSRSGSDSRLHCSSQSFAYRARKEGLQTLIDYSTIGLDYQHSGIGATKSFVEKNGDLTTRFLEALIEGIHRMKETVPSLSK